MVRSAYGAFACASAPFKGRKRRVPRYVARGTRVCYVCLHRFRGEETERDAIPSDLRKFVRMTGAVLIETVDASTEDGRDEKGRYYRPDWKWSDWYAIAIPPDGMDKVEYLCRSVKVFDGPYAGEGREGTAPGAGEVRPGARPAALRRAALREITARGNPQLLCMSLFGDRFPPLHLAPIPYAEAAVDLMPDEWQWGSAAWRKLVSQWTDFPRVYFVANLMHQCGALDVSAAVLLETWVRSRVDPSSLKPQPPTVAVKLSVAREMLDGACGAQAAYLANAIRAAVDSWRETHPNMVLHPAAPDELKIAVPQESAPRPRLKLETVLFYWRMARDVWLSDAPEHQRAAAHATMGRLRGVVRNGGALWRQSGALPGMLLKTECAL